MQPSLPLLSGYEWFIARLNPLHLHGAGGSYSDAVFPGSYATQEVKDEFRANTSEAPTSNSSFVKMALDNTRFSSGAIYTVILPY